VAPPTRRDFTSTDGDDVAQRLLDQLERVRVLLADDVHGAVHDLLGDGLLAALHDHVDEAGDGFASVLRVRQHRALRSIAFTGHIR
jgi:class 3 adenylate cyclase